MYRFTTATLSQHVAPLASVGQLRQTHDEPRTLAFGCAGECGICGMFVRMLDGRHQLRRGRGSRWWRETDVSLRGTVIRVVSRDVTEEDLDTDRLRGGRSDGAWSVRGRSTGWP